ncbi:glutamic acid-rich protein-like [Helianthus annuus]|uniref:glutamic acid-rich protein-like n=1 Tax=Helianthus annuus TaxID=4232 RepID=UPI001652D8F2|nr:glutamic acid-rich protein-like [Helianthus annuus]
MNEVTIKQLMRYHPNHPEPKVSAAFFGFIKDANYVDPDPVDHQNWRNEAEMKEAAYAEELKVLEDFKSTKNEWYVKESGRRRRKATPIVQQVDGSFSQPKKKQKKAAKTSLIDEPEEVETVVTVEKETVVAAEDDPFNVDDLFDSDILETGPTVVADVDKAANVEAQKGKGKITDDIEGDDVDKSTTSSSSYEEVVDETERLRRIQEETEKEKLLKKRKRQEKDDDDAYVPSPEHVSESQSPPGGKKKGRVRKKVVSPKIRKATPKIKMPKIVLKKKQTKETKKPPTPPHEPTPPQSPIQSPPRQPTPPQQSSPPKQPTPPRLPSPLHHSPPPQQILLTSHEIFQTPPLTQDFDFANTSQVRNVEKKVDEVVAENKKLAAENKKVMDRERILEMRVKRLENDNKELVKMIDSDQSEIDILKVRVAELEEEKARHDEQNEYFKLKNKELEAAKAFRDHEFYMLNKVVRSMLGTSVEQKFEELQVEELRAERQAKIDEQMKNKGKGVEGSSAVTERSIVPSMVVDNPEPISAVSGLFEDYTPLEELIGDSDEEDEEEEDEEEDKKDDKVYSASSHGSDDDDDDAQGGTGLKVSEASAEQNVDNLMNDSMNEESGGADRQGESGDAENVLQAHKLILRLDTYREEGEHFHTYTLEAIKEMTRLMDPDFKFDFEEEMNAEFEEELNAFDINQQRDYEYKYVEDADMYDRVEVEDWTDDENVDEDTSQLPTLMEFFTEENRD